MTWLQTPIRMSVWEVEGRGWRHRCSVCMSEGRVGSLTRKGQEGVQMAPQQTTHWVNLRNNFDFRDYRTASSPAPGRALLVSLTWSELGRVSFFFGGGGVWSNKLSLGALCCLFLLLLSLLFYLQIIEKFVCPDLL